VARAVGDSDSVRRQNRGLVLQALRLRGPMARTSLAAETGLSHASITAITADMVGQGLLLDLPGVSESDGRRGRPPVLVGFNRGAAAAVLVEIDVNRARTSLLDYAATLIDRLEVPLTPESFAQVRPSEFIAGRLDQLASRNPSAAAGLRHIAISVQGILGPDGVSLRWSPVRHLADQPLVAPLAARFGVPVSLHKRGRLLAEGVRWLDPALHDESVATVFLGSTVAMGITSPGPMLGGDHEGATEFGHMNHQPGGALCRCGMRGCIEAYAADYGVLRAAYAVPEATPPAASVPAAQYNALIARAEQGDRGVLHAFHLAGRAVGFGLSRLMTVFSPSHVLLVGPGARALGLMRGEIEAALAQSLVCKVNGAPRLVAHFDEREPIFLGLAKKTLDAIDQSHFAPLPALQHRA